MERLLSRLFRWASRKRRYDRPVSGAVVLASDVFFDKLRGKRNVDGGVLARFPVWGATMGDRPILRFGRVYLTGGDAGGCGALSIQ
jgi:hypothetical protein